MKNLFFLLAIPVSMASCTSIKKTGSSVPPPSTKKGEPRFLENISIKQTSSTATVRAGRASRTSQSVSPKLLTGSAIESCNELQFKYAILMDIAVESLRDEKLLDFLDDWYGTPYRYGGTSKSGIDCSAFSCSMLGTVYGITIPRNSQAQYNSCEKIKKKDLQEGDLVFFKNRGRISHVGVYLGNNKFVHASTSSGVMISDLDESYFSKRYAGSGRPR